MNRQQPQTRVHRVNLNRCNQVRNATDRCAHRAVDAGRTTVIYVTLIKYTNSVNHLSIQQACWID